MIRFRLAAAAALLTVAPLRAPLSAQQRTLPPQRAITVPVDDDLVARIIREGTEHSHVDEDLRYLLDVIGPRLSGSPEMQRANEWTRKKFLDYGMDTSELAPFDFGLGWTRGPMTARMLTPQRRELIAVSWAWSPGTNGPVAGDVIYLDARSAADYSRRFAGKMRGAWVMIGPAYAVLNPDTRVTPADSQRVDSIRRAAAPHTDDEQRFMQSRAALLAREGIAGVIHDGAKEFGLLTMSGSPGAIAPYPQFVISNDNYSQFQRLIARGEPVRVEADIHNSFTPAPVKQYNTIAEIRGRERPDEVVLIGAHLDSWDLATGGTDNGTGAIAVLEAARILKASGVRPRRTIRFALFGGEEEGLYGSQAYAADHEKELANFQAVLVLDNGTGRITGMALQGRDELRDMWQSLLQPVIPLGPLVLHSGMKTGTDHLAFQQYGVPSFNYDQLSRGYDHTHHSQVDDYDHTVPADIAQAATIIAVNAWQFADMKDFLPRGPKQ
jgi:carboxypeptidase Q